MIKIATHNGKFHADECMALSILHFAWGQENIKTIRSRDPKEFEKADYRIDIGGEYDPDKGNYDHHMINKPKRQHPDGGDWYSYASSGLIWKHFGKVAIQRIYQSADDDTVDFIFKYVDRHIMMPIDIADNGESRGDGLSFSTVITYFNSSWMDDESSDYTNFFTAISLCSVILQNAMKFAYGICQSRAIVFEAAKKDKVVLEFDKFVPAFNTIHEYNLPHKFIIFPDENQMWRIQCVPPTQDRPLQQRCPLPKVWAGKSQSELAKLSGIEDIIFIHPAAFIGGTKTKESALRLIELALEHKRKEM